MAGSWRLAFYVLAFLLLAGSSAEAFGGRFAFWRQPAVTAYYHAPLYLMPDCLPMPYVIPVPDANPKMKLATPTPAPPSQTLEPPLKKNTSAEPRKPVIVASFSPTGPETPTPSQATTCRVGFWNLTGMEIVLVVEGKAWRLPHDRSVRIDVASTFVWQVMGQTPRTIELSAGQRTHDVIIRD